MYKFVTIQGGCCQSTYNVSECEATANKMLKQGYVLVQVYQSTTPGCGTPHHALVMIFRKRSE